MKQSEGPWVLMLIAGMGAVMAPGLYRQASEPRPSGAEHPKPSPAGAGGRSQAGKDASPKPDDESAKVRDMLKSVLGRPGGDGTLEQAVAEYRKEGGSVATLVATVPDPALTNFDAYFDQTLESIERALEAADYVPDRFDLPWRRVDATDTAVDVELPIGVGGDRTVRVRSHGRDNGEKTPGILFFRKRIKNRDVPDALVLLAVGETATGGIHQEALRSALRISDELAIGPTNSQPLRILGPFFSATAPSLRIGLDEHECQHQHAEIDVISGSANGPNTRDIIAAAPSRPRTCFRRARRTFSTTIVPVRDLRSAVLNAIRARSHGSEEKAKSVAFLVETGTGWGHEVIDWKDDQWSPQTFRFPLHVAQLRAERERSKQSGPSDVPLANLTTTLQLHLDGDRESRDELAAQSSITPYTVELDLHEQLAAITREHYRYLGIEATDPTDTVFLAQEARKYCPGVQLITLDSQHLFTHPDLMRDLDGLVVASTYPLSEEVDGWTNPQGGRREVFPSEVAEGVYNACLALLGKMALIAEPIPYRDYRDPFAPDRKKTLGSGGARIWLTMVSNGAAYPFHVERASSDLLVTTGDVRGRHLRHSIGALAGGAYWLVLALGMAQGIWFFRRVRPGGRGTRVCQLHRARAAGVMLVALLLTCLYWTGVVSTLHRDPTTPLDGFGWRAATLFGVGVTALLALAVSLSVWPMARWLMAPGLRERCGNAQLRSLLVTAVGILVGGLALAFIVGTVVPHADGLSDGDRFLTLSRTIQPMSGVSPALPLFYLAGGLYLWGFCGYRRVEEQARFPGSVPWPDDGGPRRTGLRATAEAVAFDEPSSTFRRAELLAVGAAVIPGIYFWFRLTPTFEGHRFDDVFRAAAFLLVIAILSAVGRMISQWRDLRRLLRRLANHPMADAFGRIGRRHQQMFGFNLETRNPRADEVEGAVRIAALVGRDPLADEEIRQAADQARLTFEADDRAGARASFGRTRTALFALARLLVGALDQLRDMLPLAESPPARTALAAGEDEPSQGGSALEAYQSTAPPEIRRWMAAAEEVVAHQLFAVIEIGINRLRGLMTFAVIGSLALVFAALAYPFHPLRFVHLFAWWIALAAIVPSCIIVAGLERDHVLSRLAQTEPGRINFNPAFLGQVVLYGVLPAGALVATMFPEVGAVVFSWLQPLSRVLH